MRFFSPLRPSRALPAGKARPKSLGYAKAALVPLLAVALGGHGAIAMADTPNADTDNTLTAVQPPIANLQSFFADWSEGKLLGLPPMADFIAGTGASQTSLEYWANWLQDGLLHDRFLIPTPIDPIMAANYLPHVPVAAGSYTSVMEENAVDVRGITYQWRGRTKTVADFINDSALNSLSFVHNGAKVADYYATGYGPSTTNEAWSVTKSFTSTLVGIALDQGRIESLDDPIDKYVTELAGTDWAGTSIRNMLRMRTGMKNKDETDVTGLTIGLALDNLTGGAVGQSLHESIKSMTRERGQGEKFSYSTWSTNLLGWMLEEVYQQPYATVLSQQLWQPLGMSGDAQMIVDREGSAFAGGGLYTTPDNFARFGEFIRSGGKAPNGRQIVSANWVRMATTIVPATEDEIPDYVPTIAEGGDPTPAGFGYGYQFWSGPVPGTFEANGNAGQYVTIDPAHCLTGVRLGHTYIVSGQGSLGMGNNEWYALYQAVAAKLGGCTS